MAGVCVVAVYEERNQTQVTGRAHLQNCVMFVSILLQTESHFCIVLLIIELRLHYPKDKSFHLPVDRNDRRSLWKVLGIKAVLSTAAFLGEIH